MNTKKRLLFIPLAILAFSLLGGLVVMLLWNAILPSLLGVGLLTFPKAIGLLILCKILFGGFSGQSKRFGKRQFGSPFWKHKMMQMSEEEKEKFRSEWKERCKS